MKKEFFKDINGIQFTVLDTDRFKIIDHPDISLKFNKENGYTIMEGNNEETYSPVGAFIADIEVTTSCKGIPDENGIKKPCAFCYKSNSPIGTYMNLETYKNVLNNLNQNNTVTQVALGVDSEADTNPDLEEIFKYTRSIGIVPNLTVANITDEKVDMLVKYIGACSVSRYSDKNYCYDSVKRLTDRGMTQINIHQLVAEETFDQIIETLDDIKTDPRLAKLNAIVLLSLKQKGRGEKFHRLSDDKFEIIYRRCIEQKIAFGSDSCGCNKLIDAAKKYGNYERIKDYAEPCESGLFSSYCNVDGIFFPCSFSENIEGWETGIDLSKPLKSFLEECWYHDKTVAFRNKLLNNLDCNNCRQCPVYKI